MGQLTAPREEASPGTTTTVTTELPMSPTTTALFTPFGPGLEWEQVDALSGVNPIYFMEEDGRTVAFDAAIRGLRVLTVGDDGTVESVTAVVDGFVSRIVETDSGPIAVGTDIDGSPVVWWPSDTGDLWDSTALPGVPDDLQVFITAFLSNGAVTVIQAVAIPVTLPDSSPVGGAIEERFGPAVTWVQTGENMILVLAPLSIPVGSFTFEDLGVGIPPPDPEPEPTLTFEWSSTDGRSWHLQGGRDAMYWVENAVTGPDGRLWRVIADWSGTNPDTFVIEATTDGVSWEEIRRANGSGGGIGEMLTATQWPGGYIAVTEDREWLGVSEDLVNWDRIDLAPYLRRVTGQPWMLDLIGHRDHGVAILADLIGARMLQPIMPTLHSRGYTMSITANQIIFTNDGETVATVDLSSFETSPAVVADRSNVTFVNPANGETMITLTYAQLEALEETLSRQLSDGLAERRAQVIMFSLDGHTWSVQDASTVGPGIWHSITFAGDSIYAIVDQAGETRIFRAPVPGGVGE